jgi:hypothetical protein
VDRVADVATETAPEAAEDPALAHRVDDLLHRACCLARAPALAQPPVAPLTAAAERRTDGRALGPGG